MYFRMCGTACSVSLKLGTRGLRHNMYGVIQLQFGSVSMAMTLKITIPDKSSHKVDSGMDFSCLMCLQSVSTQSSSTLIVHLA